MQLSLFPADQPQTLQDRLTAALQRQIQPEGMAGEFNHKWTTLTTPAGRVIPKLTASAHRTSDSGSTGWPTPNALEFGAVNVEGLESRRKKYQEKYGNNGFGLTLGQAVMANWPTAKSTDGEKGGGVSKNGQDLPSTALMAPWPTTTVNDSRGGRNRTASRSDPESQHHDGLTLVDAAALARWATPAANDSEKRGVPSDRKPGQQTCLPVQSQLAPGPESSSPVGTASSGGFRLNPAFSRWLMGFPPAWDGCGVTAMPSSRKSPPCSSKPPAEKPDMVAWLKGPFWRTKPGRKS